MCDSHCSFPAGGVPVKDLLRLETLLASVVKTFSGSAVKAEVSTWLTDALISEQATKDTTEINCLFVKCQPVWGFLFPTFAWQKSLAEALYQAAILEGLDDFCDSVKWVPSSLQLKHYVHFHLLFVRWDHAIVLTLALVLVASVLADRVFLVPICIAVFFLWPASSAQMYRVLIMRRDRYKSDTVVPRRFVGQPHRQLFSGSWSWPLKRLGTTLSILYQSLPVIEAPYIQTALVGQTNSNAVIIRAQSILYSRKIFISEKFRQKRPSGSSSGIYFRQKPVVARLLFARSVVALLLIVYLHMHEYF